MPPVPLLACPARAPSLVDHATSSRRIVIGRISGGAVAMSADKAQLQLSLSAFKANQAGVQGSVTSAEVGDEVV